MNQLQNTIRWIVEDYKAYKKRFILEVIAWVISIGCSITMALTVPEPPLIYIYFFWIIGCSLYAWAAWSRKSFGLLGNYLVLVCIDTVGFIRLFNALLS